jgi:hypothetical protein
MKKLIFAALIVVSTGILSAFTLKNDTAVATKHDTVSDRKELATADARKELATADAKNHAKSDRKELATAD